MIHRGWFSLQYQVLKEISGQRWPRDEIPHRFCTAVRAAQFWARHNALDPFVPFGFHSYTLPFMRQTTAYSASLPIFGSPEGPITR